MKTPPPVSLDVANASLLRGTTRVALRPKELFRAMGMTFWLNRARTEMRRPQ